MAWDPKRFVLTSRKKIHWVSDTYYWRWCPICEKWFEVRNHIPDRKTKPRCDKCNRMMVMRAYNRKREEKRKETRSIEEGILNFLEERKS